MRKLLTLFIFSCVCLVSFAQEQNPLKELETLRYGWAKKTITGVKSGNILPLLTAFNKVWPTDPGKAILTDGSKPEAQDNEYHFVIDTPNGYVSANELGDYGQDLSACVWKRSNGHRLFAVRFTQSVGVFPHSIVLFYDFDAAKGTLTPVDHALSQFMPAFNESSVDAVSIELPQIGKDVQVQEYIMGWYFSIKHTYKWNGMEPEWSATTIENLDKMEKMYNDLYQMEQKIRFEKFALFDFDEDGNPELWLSTENDEYQAIFAIRANEIEMVASTYYKTHLIFHENNVIGSAGGCGTGCFNADYIKLGDSKPVYRFSDYQEYDYQKDEMVSTYSKDGKELSKAEGERIMKTFGDVHDITPLFQRLKK